MSDDLDNVSVKRLNATIDGLRQDNAALREENRVLRKQGELRETMSTKAINVNSAVLAAHDKRIDAFFKLVREVIGEERKAVGAIGDGMVKLGRQVEETGKHIIPQEQEFDRIEISTKGVRFSATWLKLGGYAKALPLAVKVLGVLAAIAGAVWALAAQLAHKL